MIEKRRREMEKSITETVHILYHSEASIAISQRPRSQVKEECAIKTALLFLTPEAVLSSASNTGVWMIHHIMIQIASTIH